MTEDIPHLIAGGSLGKFKLPIRDLGTLIGLDRIVKLGNNYMCLRSNE